MTLTRDGWPGRGWWISRFKEARNALRMAIRNVKNSRFQRKVEEAERECFGAKKVWKCVEDIQPGLKGLRPSRAVNIHNDDEGGEI